MAFKIGFTTETTENKPVEATYSVQQDTTAPRKSVVQVYFEGRNMTLASWRLGLCGRQVRGVAWSG